MNESSAIKANESVVFRVAGVPKPGGSKTAFYNKKLGRSMIVDACKGNKTWRQDVKYSFLEKYPQFKVTESDLSLSIIFLMPRPKCHYGSGKNADKLKESAPPFPAKKPDITKLIRSTEDALTGVLWKDDAQIVSQAASKVWAEKDEQPGAIITVISLC
jgi:Holliday junction resolvase RusA-like endonuclease